MNRDHVETLVIGGSQGRLGCRLSPPQCDLPFVIVDESNRVGDAWRNRWDSLRLFTPARYNGLPGMPFPGPASDYPTKDENRTAYFETYGASSRYQFEPESKSIGSRQQAIFSKFFCGEEALSAGKVSSS